MKCLLLLLILNNCLSIQGVLEWTVVGQVTEYGQNATLFCNVSNCCPKYAGWDRWTPVQQTLFIDVKTAIPNNKYDGKVLKDGYTLIIQNLAKNDLNASYSCVYGATIGERKRLLEEDVFTSISSTQANEPTGKNQFSAGEISALIIGGIVLVLGSATISIYFWRRRIAGNRSRGKEDDLELTVKLVDSKTERKEEDKSDLKKKKRKKKTELKECIPINIRDQIQRQISDWEKKDTMFVSTRSSNFVMKCLNENSCLTLTAPSGVGKSFIARHMALVLQKNGYKIIPVSQPDDIKNYYQPGKQTVFVVDDICGNFTANQQQIDNWKQLLPVVYTIIADTCCKIIVSCRLQVYRDDKFNILEPFKSCECNLISDNLCLTTIEKSNIAKKYIYSGLAESYKFSQSCEFFPLLCSLYNEEKHGDVNEFFENPYFVYEKELDSLSNLGDEGKFKKCCLALLVLFNNQLREKWFQDRTTNEQTQIIKDTCEACGIFSKPKINLKTELDTLIGTFVSKQNGIYRTIHDKLFDFLAYYFSQEMIDCLIEYGDSDLVHERLIWQKQPTDDSTCNIDFIIEIPNDYFEKYLDRLMRDWSEGKVTDVFCSNNMQLSSFRQKLLECLKQLDKSQEITLVNTKDTVRPMESWDSGNTPMICTCYRGYTDMVQWLLRNDVEVNHCRDDGFTGLIMASQEGHTDIVKLLLERNANVDLCNKDGCTPLFMASQQGHIDILKLLLDRNPNVDLYDKDCISPLYMASYKGHTDIVQLLLDRNANVDLCSNDGCSPLYWASHQGHTDIVKLLLDRNCKVDLCRNDGCSSLTMASQNGHIDIVKLLLERKASFDTIDNAGNRPVDLASLAGHVDIVTLLLETGS